MNAELVAEPMAASYGGLRNAIVRAALGTAKAVVGRRFTELQREMDRAQWLDREELLARSEKRLRPLIDHAVANVPRYSGLAGEVLGLRPFEALRRFPILTKAEYREGGGVFDASNIAAYRRIPRTTSGSTGQPFAFALDRAALPVIYASHLFYDSWYGFRPFDRYVRVMAPPAAVPPLNASTPLLFRMRQAATKRLQTLYEGWTQEKFFVWEVSGETASRIYARMERFKPDFILGYTSSLAVIADELLKRGLRLSKRVRGVVTVAETVTPARRKLIESYFEAPIINRYGLREFGSWSAQSCAHSPDSFHINTELVVCEVLRSDGTPAAPGEIGRVVLTDLWNYARPFIRYFTGDLAVAGPPNRCACGRGFPLFGPIEGRSRECLFTPSGKMISPTALGHYLFVYNAYLDRVRHYQLVQTGPLSVELLVVPSERWTTGVEEVLRDALEKLLDSEMSVTVRTVHEIPVEQSGKRPIIKVVAGHRTI